MRMTKTLYFGNLPWAVTPEDLQNAVSQHAEVLGARIAPIGRPAAAAASASLRFRPTRLRPSSTP